MLTPLSGWLTKASTLGTSYATATSIRVRAREGGLDAQFFSIWVEPELFGGGGQGAIKRADVQIAAVHALVERYPDTWALATSAAEIRRIAAEGKLAALLGLEGGYAIDESDSRMLNAIIGSVFAICRLPGV